MPDAPAWFKRALARLPERTFVEVDGARIETLIWGERGRPGLLLLHGNGAHADWYSFIAPFLARMHRVVTLSWSGMGGSDWREILFARSFRARGRRGGAGHRAVRSRSAGRCRTFARRAYRPRPRGSAWRKVGRRGRRRSAGFHAAKSKAKSATSRVQAASRLSDPRGGAGAVSLGAGATLRQSLHPRSYCASVSAESDRCCRRAGMVVAFRPFFMEQSAPHQPHSPDFAPRVAPWRSCEAEFRGS